MKSLTAKFVIVPVAVVLAFAAPSFGNTNEDLLEQIGQDLMLLDNWALQNLLAPEVRQIAELRRSYSFLGVGSRRSEIGALAEEIRNLAVEKELVSVCSASDLDACDENQICVRATLEQDGIRLWAEETAPLFVQVAKQSQLDCGVQVPIEPMSEASAVEYLMVLTEHVSTNSSDFGLEFAERYNSIRPIIAGEWSDELSEIFESFRIYANQFPGFVDQWEQIQDRRRLEEQQLLLSLRSELSSKLDLLNEWALRNIIDPKAAEIAALVRSANDADAQSSAELSYFSDQADRLILSAGIGQQLQPDDFPLFTDALYRPMSLYVLANLTATANNMYINLAGDLSLYENSGTFCYVSSLDPVEKYLANVRMSEAFQVADLSVSDCNKSTDIFVSLGSDLITDQVLPDVPMSNISVISEISADDRQETLARLQFERDSIARDINIGARIGYGIIQFSDAATGLCAVIVTDHDAHQNLLENESNLLSLYGIEAANISFVSDSVETIFRALQRSQCSAAYASAADLHSLSVAGQNGEFETIFLPLWISERQVSDARQILEEKSRELTDAVQGLEDRLRLDAAALQSAREQAAIRQERLRTQYDLDFRSINNAVQSLLEEVVYFAYSNSPESENYAEEYSKLLSLDPLTGRSVFHPIIENMQRFAAEGWEIVQLDLLREDYGEASFNQRSVEAIISQFNVEMRNAIVGRYETYCRRVLLIDDDAFSMLREVSLSSCDDDSYPDAWRIAQEFDSKWIVSVD